MLILTRKTGQSITIGTNIQISILEINPTSIRIGIKAPKHISIYRDEIYSKIQEQNRRAAENVKVANLRDISSLLSGKSIPINESEKNEECARDEQKQNSTERPKQTSGNRQA